MVGRLGLREGIVMNAEFRVGRVVGRGFVEGMV
jgi:hypothetical protein